MTDCLNGEQRDLALLYLAGRLPEDEAKAFEAHYFACERCARDVEEGSELRAALGRQAVTPSGREARSTPTWLPLAAAAAIAFVGVAVWQFGRRASVEPSQPVVRSSAAAVLEVRVEAGPGRNLDIAWPSHPDAAIYVVRVLSSDGTAVWKTELREPRLDLDPAVLPTPSGASFLIEVEALDSMRQVVAASEPSPLRGP